MIGRTLPLAADIEACRYNNEISFTFYAAVQEADGSCCSTTQFEIFAGIQLKYLIIGKLDYIFVQNSEPGDL